MATPLGFVRDGNDPYSGGTLSRSGRPTDVSGDFTSVGAPGFPVPTAGDIVTARGTRGTNARIVYSRIVPMHGKDKLMVVDRRLSTYGATERYEYDGIESGELAWVMSKQFGTQPHAGAGNYVGSIASLVNLPLLPHNIDTMASEMRNRITAEWRLNPGEF